MPDISTQMPKSLKETQTQKTRLSGRGFSFTGFCGVKTSQS